MAEGGQVILAGLDEELTQALGDRAPALAAALRTLAEDTVLPRRP